MKGEARRQKIMEILQNSRAAVSGATLAEKLGVSRQVIVQDIALLRASEEQILSTPRGYCIQEPTGKLTRRYHVRHSPHDLERELNIFVDAGGKVLDVIVENPVYGEIKGDLNLTSRRDVRQFIQKMEENQGIPLLTLADGIHQHTVEAEHTETLEEIHEELKKAGYLLEQKN
ncbi:MAG: transcription repressor NadR [Tissierellia bacterium]|nr:transcription repressor NadR [Tissierellia bacterium]